MIKSSKLWRQICLTSNAPRELLVAYIKALADEARLLPKDEIEVRGDYTHQENKFPQTKGEEIATDINYALITQDWIDHDSADDLEEISEIAGNLEINTDNSELWRQLFEKIDALK